MKEILIFILLILIVSSCQKEKQEYDIIQISVLAQDSISIKYFNGIDTLIRNTKSHFSTSYKLINNNCKLPKVYILKGEILSFKLYMNGNLSQIYYK